MTQPTPQRMAYRPNEAAQVSGICRTKIFELMGSGELASVKIGGRRFIPVAALQALLTPEAA